MRQQVGIKLRLATIVFTFKNVLHFSGDDYFKTTVQCSHEVEQNFANLRHIVRRMKEKPTFSDPLLNAGNV